METIKVLKGSRERHSAAHGSGWSDKLLDSRLRSWLFCSHGCPSGRNFGNDFRSFSRLMSSVPRGAQWGLKGFSVEVEIQLRSAALLSPLGAHVPLRSMHRDRCLSPLEPAAGRKFESVSREKSFHCFFLAGFNIWKRKGKTYNIQHNPQASIQCSLPAGFAAFGWDGHAAHTRAATTTLTVHLEHARMWC